MAKQLRALLSMAVRHYYPKTKEINTKGVIYL